MPMLGLSARRLATAAALLFASLVLTPATANAQQDLLSFLWGGGSREVVRFHPSYAPGQIIVSFGDRRLYWILRPGQAISYPIAIPREQDRWAGVTTVSHKAVNPAWTPTP